MSYQNPAFGEVVNGRMWTGAEWVPVEGLKPGDVIGAYMWTGTHWVEATPNRPGKPEKPVWQKWWFILIAAVLILAVIGTLDDDPAPPPAAQGQEQKEEEPDPSVPGLRDPTTDGDLEFTVTDSDADVHEIPGSFNLVHEPSGSFTLVQMTVRNVGDNPARFNWDNVEGTIADGTKIKAHSVGSYYANDRGQAGPFTRDLNPAATIEVTIAFDIPEGSELKTVICHDSLYSDGTEIVL